MFSLENKKKILNNTDLFVLDMDGTFYLENDILDGAKDISFLPIIHLLPLRSTSRNLRE